MCACANRETSVPDEQFTNSRAPTWSEYRASAIEHDDFFVVDGDLGIVGEQALRSHYDSLVGMYAEQVDKAHVATVLQTGARRVYSSVDVLDLRYCVTDDFSNYATVVADMMLATEQWEQLANINFKHVASEDDDCGWDNPNIDIAVERMGLDWAASGVAGCATFPTEAPLAYCSVLDSDPFESGAIFENILIISYEVIDDYEGITAAGVMRHELGHALGLRHEHPWNPEGPCESSNPEPVDLEIHDVGGEALSAFDVDSVMHYRLENFGSDLCNAPEGDFTLSRLDGESIRQLYGMPVSWHLAAGVI